MRIVVISGVDTYYEGDEGGIEQKKTLLLTWYHDRIDKQTHTYILYVFHLSNIFILSSFYK